MQRLEALAILQKLADGIDPYSGKVLPEDSPYQHPKTVRALFSAIQALERVKESDTCKKAALARAGQSWDHTEDDELIGCFEDGMSIKELAQKHQRTTGAIESRLVKLGKIANSPLR